MDFQLLFTSQSQHSCAQSTSICQSASPFLSHTPGEVEAPVIDDLATANAAALRARVRELEVENGLIQRELAHVGDLAERQGRQLQCGASTLSVSDRSWCPHRTAWRPHFLER